MPTDFFQLNASAAVAKENLKALIQNNEIAAQLAEQARQRHVDTYAAVAAGQAVLDACRQAIEDALDAEYGTYRKAVPQAAEETPVATEPAPDVPEVVPATEVHPSVSVAPAPAVAPSVAATDAALAEPVPIV